MIEELKSTHNTILEKSGITRISRSGIHKIIIIALLTYVITFLEFSPLYLDTILTPLSIVIVGSILVPIIIESTDNNSHWSLSKTDNMMTSSMYVLTSWFSVLIGYLVFVIGNQFIQFLSLFGSNSAIFSITTGSLSVLFGIPVLCVFYYFLYIYIQYIEMLVTSVSDDNEDGELI